MLTGVPREPQGRTAVFDERKPLYDGIREEAGKCRVACMGLSNIVNLNYEELSALSNDELKHFANAILCASAALNIVSDIQRIAKERKAEQRKSLRNDRNGTS